MGSGSKPPPAPDPYKTAGAQTGQNVQSAIANTYLGNVDQYGPQGSTTYAQTGDTYRMTGPDGQVYTIPRFAQTVTLSPEQRRLYDLNTQAAQNIGQIGVEQSARIGNLLNTPVDLSDLRVDPNSFSADRARVEQALFDRVAPQQQRDYDALENRLTNQGFQRGTEAFNAAMDEHRRGINDQRLAITARGLQEQQGMYGMASQAQQAEIARRLQQRNAPIQEVGYLMGLGQYQTPQAQAYHGGQINPADVSGAIYNSAALANKQWEQEQANKNAMMGGLFGIGQAAALGAMGMPPGMFGGLKSGGNSPKWGG